MIKRVFGSNLKRLRLENEHTRESLAELTEVSSVQIYKLESGKSFVSASLLEKLSAVLNVEPYLFFVDQNKMVDYDLMYKSHAKLFKDHLVELIDEHIINK